MEYVINFNYVKLNDSIIQVKFVIAKISNYYCRYVDFSLMLYQFLLHASWSSTVSEFFLSELRPRNFSGSKWGNHRVHFISCFSNFTVLYHLIVTSWKPLFHILFLFLFLLLFLNPIYVIPSWPEVNSLEILF